MADADSDKIRRACRKLGELHDLLRQNFTPAPESVDLYNACVDLLIEAGRPADGYKVDKNTTPMEFRDRLNAVTSELCGSIDGAEGGSG